MSVKLSFFIVLASCMHVYGMGHQHEVNDLFIEHVPLQYLARSNLGLNATGQSEQNDDNQHAINDIPVHNSSISDCDIIGATQDLTKQIETLIKEVSTQRQKINYLMLTNVTLVVFLIQQQNPVKSLVSSAVSFMHKRAVKMVCDTYLWFLNKYQ